MFINRTRQRLQKIKNLSQHKQTLKYNSLNLKRSYSNGFLENGVQYLGSLDGNCLEFVNYVDDFKLRSISHTGWYCNLDYDNTYRGCILKLKGRVGGCIRVYAAYYDVECGGYVIDWSDKLDIDTKRGDCYFNLEDSLYCAKIIYNADYLAKVSAESSKQYMAKGLADQEITDKIDLIEGCKDELKALLKERKYFKKLGIPSKILCDVIKEKVSMLIIDIRRHRKRIKLLRDEPLTLLYENY
jgi:hypothetical protein